MRSASLVPSIVTMSVTDMAPSVSVPVLSNTTVVMRRVRSSTSTDLMRIPSWAPRPVPTMIAIGVANPSAHGQAMISTATAAYTPLLTLPPMTVQPRNVSNEIDITTGTNTAEIWSAKRCAADFPVWASSTSLTIWASAVSEPIAVALMVRTPEVLSVAPATLLPDCLSTGSDSPVSIDSSTALAPSTTSPSTGTFSPGRILTRSPTCTDSTGTISSTPSRTRRASLAPNSTRARSALPARPFARASRYRPKVMKNMITTAASKYSSIPPVNNW